MSRRSRAAVSAPITLGAATGPAGMIYRRTNYAQPYFDEAGAPSVYPLYHVVAGLAAASGSKVIAAKSAAPGKVAALACARQVRRDPVAGQPHRRDRRP